MAMTAATTRRRKNIQTTTTKDSPIDALGRDRIDRGINGSEPPTREAEKEKLNRRNLSRDAGADNNGAVEPSPSSVERIAALSLLSAVFLLLVVLLCVSTPHSHSLNPFRFQFFSDVPPSAEDVGSEGGAATNMETAMRATGDAAESCAANHLINATELAAHVGEGGASPSNPIWLAVLGKVYDVTTGEEFYGHGKGGYSMFAGRDASPCFATGKFTLAGVEEPIDDLDGKKLMAILEWSEFYDTHETYKCMGLLAGGIFYDEEGNERPLRKDVVTKASEAKVVAEKEKNEKRKARVARNKNKKRGG